MMCDDVCLQRKVPSSGDKVGAFDAAAVASFSESLRDFVKSKSDSDGTGSGVTCPVTVLIPSEGAGVDAGK